MTVPQTAFSCNTPSARTDGSVLAPGDIASIGIAITDQTLATPPVSYSFPVPPAQVPGTLLNMPFAGLTPVFVPVPGHQYSADADDTDQSGLSSGFTAPVVWTQAVATPAAPSGFSVA